MSIFDKFKSFGTSAISRIGGVVSSISGAIKTVNIARPALSFASTVTSQISKPNQQRIGGISNSFIGKAASALGTFADAAISRISGKINPRPPIAAPQPTPTANNASMWSSLPFFNVPSPTLQQTQTAPLAGSPGFSFTSPLVLIPVVGLVAYLIFTRGKK